MGVLWGGSLVLKGCRSVGGRVLGMVRPGQVGELLGVERLGDLDGRGKDSSLDNLKLSVLADERGGAICGQLGVDLFKSSVQLSSDA